MWILLVIWIIFFVDGNVINECRLVLHAVATALCQIYLALLPLRQAARHFAKAAWNISFEPFVKDPDKCFSSDDEERLSCFLSYLRKAAVNWLEAVCFLWEFLSQVLAVMSTLCVAVRHVLQAALFPIVSTARWVQKMLLFKDDVDEWMKEQEQQRERLQKQRREMEEYICAGDQLTGKKRLRGVDKSLK